MPKITYTFNVNNSKRTIGWGSSKSNHSSKPTRPEDKSTAIITLSGEKIKLGDITINSAELKIVFNKTGRNASKTFEIGFGSGSENITSLNEAYNQITSFNLTNSAHLLNWLNDNTTTLTFSDPSDTIFSINTIYCTPAYSNFRRTDSSEAYCDIAYQRPTLTIDYSFKKATLSIDNNEITTGKEKTVDLQNTQDGYTYDLYYKISNGTETLIQTINPNISSTKTFAISGSNIFNKDNSTLKTISGELILKTKEEGNFIGTSSLPVIFLAGSDCNPSLGTISITSDTTIAGAVDYCAIPGKSKITFTFPSSSGKNGATIQKYQIKTGSISSESSQKAITITTPFTTSNFLSFSCSVIDSRGLISSTNKIVYLSPEITNNCLKIDEYFRTSDLIETDNIPSIDDSGEYLYLKYTYDTSIRYRGLNYQTIKTYNNASNIVVDIFQNDTEYILSQENSSTNTSTRTSYGLIGSDEGAENFSADTSHVFSIRLRYGNYTISKEISYSTANYLIHFRKGQKSIGIGIPGKDLIPLGLENLLSIKWQTEISAPLIISALNESIPTFSVIGESDSKNTAFSINKTGDVYVNNRFHLAHPTGDPRLIFQAYNVPNKPSTGIIFYHTTESEGDLAKLGKGYFYFKQYSRNTKNYQRGTFSEYYSLPGTTDNLTKDASYNILTTKTHPSLITIGESISINTPCYGFTTENSKEFILTILLSRPIPSTATGINITRMIGKIRGGETYLMGNSSGHSWFISGSSLNPSWITEYDCLKIDYNNFSITVKFTMAETHKSSFKANTVYIFDPCQIVNNTYTNDNFTFSLK